MKFQNRKGNIFLKDIKGMNIFYNYHRKDHKCPSEAYSKGPGRILPKLLVVSLRNPILLHEKAEERT